MRLEAEPEIVAGRSPHRFETLDALRGICACLVALYHFRDSASPLAATAFVGMSWQFVDLFFVISGFVIALNYQEKLRAGLSLGTFMRARVARIYPLHVAILAIFLLTELAFLGASHLTSHARTSFDAAHQPSDLIKQLLFIDGLGNVQEGGWNYPTWSIATEFWAYVVFGLAAIFLRGRALAIFAAGVIVACPVFLFYFSPRGIQTIAEWGLIRCVYGFAIGAVCWHLWAFWRRKTLNWTKTTATIVESATLVAVLIFVPVAGPTKWNLLAPLLFGLTVLVFARQAGFFSRLLTMRVPIYLGTISYSIYLVHVFVEARMRNLSVALSKLDGHPHTTTIIAESGNVQRLTGASGAEGTVFMVVMLLVVVAAASVTYRFVEMPGQRWLRPAKVTRSKPSLATVAKSAR